MATQYLKNINLYDNEIKIIIDSSLTQRYAYFKKSKALHFRNWHNYLNLENEAINYVKEVLKNEYDY